MKAKLVSDLVMIAGIVFFAALMYIAYIIKDIESDTSIIIAMFAVIMFLGFSQASSIIDQSHYQKILQKHGLWEKDFIKKSELKK